MIVNGSWQNELPKIKSNSIDLIIIDPPYLTTNEKWDKEYCDIIHERLEKEKTMFEE